MLSDGLTISKIPDNLVFIPKFLYTLEEFIFNDFKYILKEI